MFKENHPISSYTSFGVGGIARYFCEIESSEQAVICFEFIKQNQLKWIVLGKGSNVVLSSKYFDGLVIVNKINFCHYLGSTIEVGAGYNFALLGVKSSSKNLGGLEFAAGIPASVGGAIYMNAGANGQETQDCLSEVEFVTEDGSVLLLKKDELNFSYRTSPFQNMKGIITKAKFQLYLDNEAKEKQKEILLYRLSTQPYKAKTAGCMFQNPKSRSAGAIIEACGLKGFKIGSAQVSLMHANFIENINDANSEDIISLVHHIKKVVYEKEKIELKLEVKFIG
ncbi:MAG: UDP-N-acetylmuramate dehydrogenase [Rhabdochlamydiaceae bacterium]|nr:UDP-N-acetylmuramate dehydrogenase [Candidatus Amphrikana amoebophyrae]